MLAGATERLVGFLRFEVFSMASNVILELETLSTICDHDKKPISDCDREGQCQETVDREMAKERVWRPVLAGKICTTQPLTHCMGEQLLNMSEWYSEECHLSHYRYYSQVEIKSRKQEAKAEVVR